jgi:hypothetical protein
VEVITIIEDYRPYWFSDFVRQQRIEDIKRQEDPEYFTDYGYGVPISTLYFWQVTQYNSGQAFLYYWFISKDGFGFSLAKVLEAWVSTFEIIKKLTGNGLV